MKFTPVQGALFVALGMAIGLPILKYVYGSKPNFLQDSFITPLIFFFVFWLFNYYLFKKGKWK